MKAVNGLTPHPNNTSTSVYPCRYSCLKAGSNCCCRCLSFISHNPLRGCDTRPLSGVLLIMIVFLSRPPSTRKCYLQIQGHVKYCGCAYGKVANFYNLQISHRESVHPLIASHTSMKGYPIRVSLQLHPGPSYRHGPREVLSVFLGKAQDTWDFSRPHFIVIKIRSSATNQHSPKSTQHDDHFQYSCRVAARPNYFLTPQPRCNISARFQMISAFVIAVAQAKI